MIEKLCRKCGRKAMLLDSYWDDREKCFVRLYECPECRSVVKQKAGAAVEPDQSEEDELELLKRVNRRLSDLEERDDE